MQPVITAILQILAFMATNKDAIKQIVQNIEALIPDAPGAIKSAQLKSFIGTALGLEAQIETVWPMVSGIFNVFVAQIKAKAPVAA